MTSRGLKRKFPVEPEEISPAWEHQRQSVLDISIEKFQRDLTLVEPSLRRSVLIANTLRQIQLEEPMPSPNDTVVPPVEPVKTRTAPIQHSLLQSNFSHQGPVQSFPAVTYCPTLTENHGDEWMSTSPEEEFSLSTAISSILKELDGDGCQDSSQPSLSPLQRMPLGSIENLPGSLDAGPRHRPGWAGQRGEECGRRVEGSPLGGMAVTRPAYLHDVTLDSLFVDVDMSVFDREVSSLGARAFSTIANEELVKYLPSLSASNSPVLSNQGVKDLHELEHIMEILVES